MDVPTPTEAPRRVRCRTRRAPRAACLTTRGAPLATRRVRCAVPHAPRHTRPRHWPWDARDAPRAAACAAAAAPAPAVSPRTRAVLSPCMQTCGELAPYVPPSRLHPALSGRHARRRRRPAATTTHGPCGADDRHRRPPPPQSGRRRGRQRSLPAHSPATYGAAARRAARASMRPRRGAPRRALWGRGGVTSGRADGPTSPRGVGASAARDIFFSHQAHVPHRRPHVGRPAAPPRGPAVRRQCGSSVARVWPRGSRPAACRAGAVDSRGVASAAGDDGDAARRGDTRAGAARRAAKPRVDARTQVARTSGRRPAAVAAGSSPHGGGGHRRDGRTGPSDSTAASSGAIPALCKLQTGGGRLLCRTRHSDRIACLSYKGGCRRSNCLTRAL